MVVDAIVGTVSPANQWRLVSTFVHVHCESMREKMCETMSE